MNGKWGKMTLGEKVSNIVGWITDSLTGSNSGYGDDDIIDNDAFSFRENDGYSYEGSAVRKPATYSTRVSSEETNVFKHPR